MASAVTISAQDSLEEGRSSACLPRSKITLLQKAAAEFLGTFILVYGGCGAWVVDKKYEGQLTHTGVSLAWGTVVVALVYTLGHISGCHVNPAVSIALASVKKFSWTLVPIYVLAQCLGAICASFTLRLSIGFYANLGAAFPTGNAAEALAAEIAITFILMFVIMSVCTDDRAIPHIAGAAIGAVVTVNALIAGPISGASMNPARSLGPALASSYYHGFWVYVVGPCLGALGGAWAYQMIRLPKVPTQADMDLDLKAKF